MMYLNELLSLKFLNDYFDNHYIEKSVKIKEDIIFSDRNNFWFDSNFKKNINKVFSLFKSIEQIYNVSFNYSLIKKYFDKNFDFSKLKYFIFGYDLRENILESRLKIWFIIKDYPDKLEQLKENMDDSLKKFMFNDEFLFGFDFGFDNSSRIKFYPLIYSNDVVCVNDNINSFDLPKKVVELISASKYTHITLDSVGSYLFHFHFDTNSKTLNDILQKIGFNNFLDEDFCDIVLSLSLKDILKNSYSEFNLYGMYSIKINFHNYFKYCLDCSDLFSCSKKNENNVCYIKKNIKFLGYKFSEVLISELNNITENKKTIFLKLSDKIFRYDFENYNLSKLYFSFLSFSNLLNSEIFLLEKKEKDTFFELGEKIDLNLNKYDFLFENISGKVLDVGFGDFFLTEHFNLNKKYYFGLEPDIKSYEIIKKKFPDLSLFNSSFEDFDINVKFDYLVFFGSINHMNDIHKVFRKINILLNKNGSLIIAEHLPVNVLIKENSNKENLDNSFNYHNHNYKMIDMIHLLLLYGLKIEYCDENDLVWIIKAIKK